MPDNTIYVVSGFPRTGTSAMMNALKAGGMEIVFDSEREKLNETFSTENYKLNDCKIYETAFREYDDLDFPLRYRGTLLKVFHWGLYKMRAASYRIVYMLRDFEAWKQSYQSSFFVDLDNLDQQTYEEKNNRAIEIMRSRNDVQIMCVDYIDLCEYPDFCFSGMKKRGWPIDVNAAQSVIDSNKRRY